LDRDHERSKEKQIERYQQGMKRFRTLAERKALEQESRERRARRGRRGRDDGDDRDADDDEHGRTPSAARAPKRGRGPFEDAGRGRAAAEPVLPREVPPVQRRDVPHEVPREGPRDAEHGAATPRARAAPAPCTALVVGLAPGRAHVRLEPGGEECDARLAEALARTQRAAIAVGDRVEVRLLPGHLALVESVLPRRSLLARLDSARPGGQQLVAANVDRAVVVAAAAQPAFRPRLVDRYLVALERGGIAPFVALGKVDLVGARERDELCAFLAELAAIGVPGALVSTLTGEGLESVRAAVVGTTFVLVGQSGVGKSSLANALFPAVAARTGAVRTGDGKGRHTTTAAHLFAVDARGTCVVDTPGVRSFGLANLARSELAAYFPDFDAHRAACRFADCSHSHEPGCGVRAAVLAGALAARRHAAYLRILESLE
jgi:ribosome biogenesis GTPase